MIEIVPDTSVIPIVVNVLNVIIKRRDSNIG